MHSPDIHVRSVGTALPGPAIDNASLARRFDMPSAWEQWIDAFVGTRSRHFARDLDTGEISHTPTDLGETAGRRALKAAGLTAADIDLMVMATSSPEQLMPATVNLIADRLGIDGIPAYQLQSGCTGAFQAMDVASQLLRAGRHRNALVLGTETCAKHLDLTLDVATLPPAQQINGVLFGDGAGAVVLAAAPEPRSDSVVVRDTFVRLVGLNRPPGQIVEWFGKADHDRDRPPVLEDYKEIENSVPVLAAEALDELLGRTDWKEDEVDYLLPPQLSGVMTTRIAERLDVPGAHEVSVVREIGNTGNALPFFQLERLLPRMISGDRAVALSVESSKWIKAGLALEKG